MADAANLAQAINQRELSRLPLFYGDGKGDAFSAEEWAERVTRAAQAAGWDDNNTMTSVYNALRGPALAVYMSLRRRNSPVLNTWAQFQVVFLENFSKTRNARTTTAVLGGLQQRQGENTLQFYTRVDQAMADIDTITPIANMPADADPWPAQIAAVPEFMANGLAVHRQTILTRAYARAGDYRSEAFGVQLYLAGLKPAIRERILANPPAAPYANMWAAFQHAQTIERAFAEPGKDGEAKNILAIQDEEEEVEKDANEVAAMRYNRGTSRGRFRGRGRGQGRNMYGQHHRLEQPSRANATIVTGRAIARQTASPSNVTRGKARSRDRSKQQRKNLRRVSPTIHSHMWRMKK